MATQQGGSDEGTRKTGILFTYRLESWEFFKGDFETRHEAVGHAAIVGRIMEQDYQVSWKESMWREVEEPTVCGECGFESHYRPLVRWTFAAGIDTSPFCSDDCWESFKQRNQLEEDND